MRSVVVFVICSLVVSVPSLWASWIHDGVPLCTATGEQDWPAVISDGAGGAIVSWRDSRSGQYDIYAQRVDASGVVQWTADGVALCTASGSQEYEYQLMASDGDGGAIVAWDDNRSGNPDIYAQRVDASGIVRWTVDGVALCTNMESQYNPTIVSDDAGGAIVTWYDWRSGHADIYAQRVDSSGVVQWTPDGVALCTASAGQYDPAIASDGASGAIVTWHDYRDGNGDIYAQRVDSSGVVRWTVDGVLLCTDSDHQQLPQMVPDGAGGAIVAWEDERGMNSDIYAQRVDSSGVVMWTVDGVLLSTAVGYQRQPMITSDGAGGAVVTWYGGPTGSWDIHAQRVDSSGVVQWAADAVPICTAALSQWVPRITSDGAGGAIVTWYDYRDWNHDIYAQWVNATGEVQWTVDGVPLCTASGDQMGPTAVSDGAGGAVITWGDYRSGNDDIYVQCINRYGHPGFGFMAPDGLAIQDVPGDQGGKLTIQWDASTLDIFPPNKVTHYSVWRRLVAVGGEVAFDGWTILSAAEGIPAGLEGRALRYLDMESDYAWEWIANIPARQFERYAYTARSLSDSMGVDPGWQYFIVCAHTPDPLVYYDSPIDSGYSVDNLSPCPPLGLAGEQSYVSEGLSLSWSPNTETDLGHYAVYRDITEDFTPDPGNLIASPSDTSHFDSEWRWNSGYYYKVSVMDVHGNESPFTLLRPEDVTGDEVPAVPMATYLRQNYPNPFNPSTIISFGLKEYGNVDVRIYNAAGCMVRVLVNEQREASHYEEIWDGCNDAGHSVASGIYFYRLVAGDFVQTKKMVLLR